MTKNVLATAADSTRAGVGVMQGRQTTFQQTNATGPLSLLALESGSFIHAAVHGFPSAIRCGQQASLWGGICTGAHAVSD